MRTAHIAPVATTIPAPKDGSVEQVTALWTEELVKRGHEVTLFATGNTQTSARLHAVFPHGYWEDIDTWPWEHCELTNLAAAYDRADEFDVINCQAPFIPPLGRPRMVVMLTSLQAGGILEPEGRG